MSTSTISPSSLHAEEGYLSISQQNCRSALPNMSRDVSFDDDCHLIFSFCSHTLITYLSMFSPFIPMIAEFDLLFAPIHVAISTLLSMVADRVPAISEAQREDVSNSLLPHIMANESILHWFTGFTNEEFAVLYQQCLPCLTTSLHSSADEAQPGRHRKLSPKYKLLLVLVFVNKYLTEVHLSLYFGISPSRVTFLLMRLIPILLDLLQYQVSFPAQPVLDKLKGTFPNFPNAVACVDFKNQEVEIPLNGEHAMYRGDKDCHFINSLGVCDASKVFLAWEAGNLIITFDILMIS